MCPPGTAEITFLHDNGSEKRKVHARYNTVADFAVGLANMVYKEYREHYEIIHVWLVPRKFIQFDRHGDVNQDEQRNAVIDSRNPIKEYDISIPLFGGARVKAIYVEDK